MKKKYITITDSDGNHFLKGWMTFDIFWSAVAAINNGDESWKDYLTEIFFNKNPFGVTELVGNAKIEIKNYLSLDN